MRDYDPTTGRYLQADPLGLVDGAAIYNYALQNPGRYIDPRGKNSLVACAGGPIPCVGGIIGAVGVIILGSLPGSTPQLDQGGKAATPSPHSHVDEENALAFVPDPFGGKEYCLRLKREINVLRKMKAWRLADLNPKSSPSVYSGHKKRIGIIERKLKKLEDHYEIVCGGKCPVE